jgi:hypothetical protein
MSWPACPCKTRLPGQRRPSCRTARPAAGPDAPAAARMCRWSRLLTTPSAPIEQRAFSASSASRMLTRLTQAAVGGPNKGVARAARGADAARACVRRLCGAARGHYARHRMPPARALSPPPSPRAGARARARARAGLTRPHTWQASARTPTTSRTQCSAAAGSTTGRVSFPAGPTASAACSASKAWPLGCARRLLIVVCACQISTRPSPCSGTPSPPSINRAPRSGNLARHPFADEGEVQVNAISVPASCVCK